MNRMRQVGAAALIGYTLLFFAFIYLPIIVIAVYSFNADPVNMMHWSGFTFDWYKKIFGFKAVVSETALYIESTDQLIAAVKNSVVVAAATRLRPGDQRSIRGEMDEARAWRRRTQPLAEPKPRLMVYETDSSRGEIVSLRPGETINVAGVRYLAAYCLSGRIMCLMKNDKLALEASEGVCLVSTPADLVGASGISTVAIFSTTF